MVSCNSNKRYCSRFQVMGSCIDCSFLNSVVVKDDERCVDVKFVENVNITVSQKKG